jgi:AcrR family transcriptional regulator
MNPRSASDSEVPSLRSRLRQATDEAILAAAEHAFAEEGLHAARMGDIAARAGVAVGTLYNHFQDRDALLAGLLERRRVELLDLFDATLRAHAREPFRRQLVAFLGAFLHYYAAHRRFFFIVTQGETNSPVSTAGALAPGMAREIYLRIEKLVKRGLKDGSLRPDAAGLYPALLMGMLRGVMIRERCLGVEAAPVDAEEVARCFLDGTGAAR